MVQTRQYDKLIHRSFVLQAFGILEKQIGYESLEDHCNMLRKNIPNYTREEVDYWIQGLLERAEVDKHIYHQLRHGHNKTFLN